LGDNLGALNLLVLLLIFPGELTEGVSYLGLKRSTNSLNLQILRKLYRHFLKRRRTVIELHEILLCAYDFAL
jgi:hypothetical protein